MGCDALARPALHLNVLTWYKSDKCIRYRRRWRITRRLPPCGRQMSRGRINTHSSAMFKYNPRGGLPNGKGRHGKDKFKKHLPTDSLRNGSRGARRAENGKQPHKKRRGSSSGSTRPAKSAMEALLPSGSTGHEEFLGKRWVARSVHCNVPKAVASL